MNSGVVMSVTRNTRRSTGSLASEEPAASFASVNTSAMAVGGQRVAAGALEARRRLDLEAVLFSERSKRCAALDLLNHFVGLGLQTRGNFIVAPLSFDLGADFLQRAVARRGDAGHFVPDVTARNLHGIVFDADVGCECVGEDVEVGRHVRFRIAVRATARTVNRIDGADGNADLLRDFLKPRAAGELVLDLVAASRVTSDLGALVGEFGFQVQARLARRSSHALPARSC